MWKDLLDKSKCLLGFHDGPWTYRQPGTCAQTQTCTRCRKVTERVEHTWGDWTYKADQQCDLIRTCARCSHAEQKLEHTWGEPAFLQPKACERASTCQRCGLQQRAEPAHVFDRWSYQDDDDCTQTRTCSRCGQAGTGTRLHHDWNAWIRSEFYESPVRVCRHCGEMLLDAGGGAPGEHEVSMTAIDAGIHQLIASQNGVQVRAALRGTQGALLTPAVGRYFQFAFDQYPDELSGSLRGAQALVTRCREVGVDTTLQELGLEAPPAPAAPPPASRAASRPAAGHAAAASSASLDQRLIGHWRSTEILGAGSGFSMTIDTHCVLDGGGQLEFWSRTADGQGDVEAGTWSAATGELTLRFGSGDALVRDYRLDGNHMLWPGDSRYRLWERIG